MFPARRSLPVALLVVALAGPVAAAPGAEQARPLERLAEDSTGPVVVRRHAGSRRPSFVTASVPVSAFSFAPSVRAQARDFWETYGGVFGVTDPEGELALREVERDRLGMTHLRFDQRHRGLDVFGHRLLLHLRGERVTVANGDFAPEVDVTTTPAVSAEAATGIAAGAVPARAVRTSSAPAELLVFVDGAGRDHLAWSVLLPTTRPLGLWRVFVDALTGEPLRFYDELHTARDRQTHTNGNDRDCWPDGEAAPTCTLPGVLVRAEVGPATGDQVTDAAHDHAGTVYDYYWNTFGRDSYNGAGRTIRSTVHFGIDYNNAFWCPSECAAVFGSPLGEQVVYGDGDDITFSPLAEDLDVVAHELTHGVTESEADLIYFGQSGALNESYSDVFAAMVDTGDWTIAEASWTPGTSGDALRNMADPSNEDQPEHMSQFEFMWNDAGGVHINSGIPNHAAYLVSEGPGYGIGRDATQRIYYRALTTYLTPTSDFLDNLNALLLASQDVFPGDTAKRRAIERAHAAVGIVNAPRVVSPNGGERLKARSTTAVSWSLAGDTGLPFRVDYGEEPASTGYTQGFDGGASLPAGFVGGGDASWLIDGTTGVPNPPSARSGAIGNNGSSTMSVTLRLASPGVINFNARVSSQANADFFSFHVDGEPLFAGSGEIPWSPAPTTSLPTGVHTLTWVYDKNSTGTAGQDRAWVDGVSVTNAAPADGVVIGAPTDPTATSVPWTVPAGSGRYLVRVSTPGVAPWLGSDLSDGSFAIVDPGLAVSNAKKREGDAGTPKMRFRVRLDEAVSGAVTVKFRTRNGTARAPRDFRPARGTLSFAPGETSETVVVALRGDRLAERTEAFTVVLSAPSGAVIADPSGKGRIRNDD
jgi:Zn-dependent metalloprotease